MSSPFGVGNATFRIGGEKKYVDTLAFGIYRKKVFEVIGNFNEELVRNQDDELNYRLTKNGFKILYDPAIQSQYFVRGSIGKLYKQYFQYGYWKVYVNKLHKAVTSIRQLVPLIFVLGILLGAVITAIFPYFAFLYIPGIALYLTASVYFGIKSAKSVGTGLRVALVFPVLHWSYGIGYLKGIIMFLLFNKKPSKKSKSLSRK
jgi:GT2 family glycosyltransferase